MTNPTDYPLNASTLIDLADASAFDDIYAYALDAANEIIADARANCPLQFTATDDDIAAFISADLLESSTFTNLPCDPELMHLMLETIISTILRCAPSRIAANF